MLKQSLPSIEQFAAFIDGNLPQSEMQKFSQLVEHDSVLHQLMNANFAVENTIASFTDSDLQLPPEIVSSKFELPPIPTDDIMQLDMLSQEPMDNMFVAAAASAEDVNTTISDVSQEHHISIDSDVHNDSLLSNLGNDDFDNGDDSLSLYESADHANDEYGILQPNDNGNIFSEQNEL